MDGFTERTNLYRATAQTLEWVAGLTRMEFEIASARLAEVQQELETHYSFEILTNSARISGTRHPLALNVEDIQYVLTGVADQRPDSLVFDERIAELEIQDLPAIKLQQDKGGFARVSVQTKMFLFTGAEETFVRHFVYRHNFLHAIR